MFFRVFSEKSEKSEKKYKIVSMALVTSAHIALFAHGAIREMWMTYFAQKDLGCSWDRMRKLLIFTTKDDDVFRVFLRQAHSCYYPTFDGFGYFLGNCASKCQALQGVRGGQVLSGRRRIEGSEAKVGFRRDPCSWCLRVTCQY